MTTPSTTKRLVALLVAVALLAATVAAFALPAAAAGETSVRLVSETDQVSVDETTTVDVVVTNADGGVGAYNATFSVGSEHARITNVTLPSDTGLKRIRVDDDGATAHVAAALLNTSDSGEATIATLTIEGATAGESDIAIVMHELGDEQGRTYDVADTSGTSLTVTDQVTEERTEATAAASADVGEETDAPADVSAAMEDSNGLLEGILAAPSLLFGSAVLLVIGLGLGVLIGRRR